MTDITPEILRTVADWYETRNNARGFADIVTELREDANLIEEKVKLDRLVRLYWIEWIREFDPVNEVTFPRGIELDAIRAGIRGVLAAIDAQKEADSTKREPRTWNRLDDVPHDVVVTDRDGARWEWQPHHSGWAWIDSTHSTWRIRRAEADTDAKLAPFTEVIPET